MSLKVKYIGCSLYMIIAPMLIKLTPYPFSLIWCLAYGSLLGNILYYSYRYQKRQSDFKELIKLNNDYIKDLLDGSQKTNSTNK